MGSGAAPRGWHAASWVGWLAARAGGAVAVGGVIQSDGVQAVFGELLAAATDGLDRGAAEQVGQAADHPAGALVQVAVQPDQRARPVTVEPQGVLQGGDQALPLAGVGERDGGDQPEPAGELLAAGAGKQ